MHKSEKLSIVYIVTNVTIIIYLRFLLSLLLNNQNEKKLGFVSFNFKAFCSIMGDVFPIVIAI